MQTLPRGFVVASLASSIAAALLIATPAWATTYNVTSCANDGTGSLRAVVTSAVSAGDVVDLSTLPLDCSTITLTTGALVATNDNLVITGPVDRRVSVSAGYASRVIEHHGQALAVKYLTVRDGSATGTYATGGCINTTGSLTLFNATVSECSVLATTDDSGVKHTLALGGGIYTYNKFSAFFSQVTDTHTYAQASPTGLLSSSYGGAVFCRTDLELKYSDISRSSAFVVAGNLASGGGVWVGFGHNITIEGSTIRDNHADFSGGGLWMNPASADIENSTISGNNASTGGGILMYNGYASISSSTIAFNHATSIGGISARNSIAFQSTIIANNTEQVHGFPADFAVPLNSGTVATGANNLIMDADDATIPPLTLHTDPKLAPLALNNGYTMSHALLPGSPAIDHGNDSASLDVDQRDDSVHYPRDVGAARDIGAFEVNPDIIFFDPFDQRQFKLF